MTQFTANDNNQRSPVRQREYNGTTYVQSTLTSLWSGKVPSTYKGKVFSDINAPSFRFSKDDQVLVKLASKDADGTLRVHLLVNGNPVAALQSATTKDGKPYFWGTTERQAQGDTYAVSSGVKFNLWRPFPGGNAEKKGAKWTLKCEAPLRGPSEPEDTDTFGTDGFGTAAQQSDASGGFGEFAKEQGQDLF